ncbi:hypothetical protein MPSEU_000736200 [Mayamaea pseudoterrestris]|nr:hypothetical protein MPSEU_000736200 [Mayamaea pseudoterrestris]
MSHIEPLLPKDLDVEEAETANIESLEQGVLSSTKHDYIQGDGVNSRSFSLPSSTKRKFQRGVRKAMIAKQLANNKVGVHRRKNSTAKDMLRQISIDTSNAACTQNSTQQSKSHQSRRSFEDVMFLTPLLDDTDSADSADDDGNDNNGGTQYGTLPGSRSSHRLSRPINTNANTDSFCWSSRISRNFCWTSIQAVFHSMLLWIALPCAIAALILYYMFSNPVIDFLPGSVTIAWWFNFAARQTVTFELARLLQYVFVDSLLLKSRWDHSQIVSFVAYHVQGWPFILIAWATIDMFVLHGNNQYHLHWLWWTKWKIYTSEANSGAYILTSGLYLRILLSMMFLGVATATKRCILELKFGGRLHRTFQPKLEQILREIVLVTEIAALGEEADRVEDLEDVDTASFRTKVDQDIGVASQAVNWSTASIANLSNANSAAGNAPTPGAVDSSKEGAGVDLTAAVLSNGNNSIAGIEAFLDRWEEPTHNGKKDSVIGVNDAVTFRQVLAHLRKKTPFGESFGPTWNRQVTITSSQTLYNRLLKLSDASMKSLPFDTLSVIAYGSDGTMDNAKLDAVRKVFCPDAQGQLPLIAFVGSVDAVYKRLRFFQASVANASKLDKVLEDTLNVVFFFVLGLLILVFMNFNPWPVLVSITSLLVSVSFALGTSLSKWVEGILLIAVRRPYDLGDRIIITSAESLESPGSSASWYVEDINLFSTTLRYARTNEVSSLNNSSIAASRIINCNRSSHAIVFLDKVTHISILDSKNLEQFQLSLENYVRDHPRIWDSLAFLRIESIDTNEEQVKFSMAFRHRNSWQDAGRILLNRADLVRFVFDALKGLDAAYDTPPIRQLVYYGGELEEGQVKDYKLNLLNAANIRKKSGRPQSLSVDLFDSLQKPLEGE